MWIRSVCTTRLPSPSICGLRSPGHCPKIAHCQIRSSFPNTGGVPPTLLLAQPSVFLPFTFLPAALPCLVLRPAGPLMTNAQKEEGSSPGPECLLGVWAGLGAPPLFSGSGVVCLSGEGPCLPDTPAPGPSPIQLCSKKPEVDVLLGLLYLLMENHSA